MSQTANRSVMHLKFDTKRPLLTQKVEESP